MAVYCTEKIAHGLVHPVALFIAEAVGLVEPGELEQGDGGDAGLFGQLAAGGVEVGGVVLFGVAFGEGPVAGVVLDE